MIRWEVHGRGRLRLLSEEAVWGSWCFGEDLAAHCGERLYVALDLARDFILGDFQVIARLQIHPKGWAVSEIACKAERRIGGDSSALVDDIRDARHWNAESQGQLVHAHIQRSHELFAESFSGMHRFSFFRHALLLVVLDDPDLQTLIIR